MSRRWEKVCRRERSRPAVDEGIEDFVARGRGEGGSEDPLCHREHLRSVRHPAGGLQEAALAEEAQEYADATEGLGVAVKDAVPHALR